jgi:hypothetical protein
MKQVKGSELSAQQQREVISAFVYRVTGDHTPKTATPSQKLQFANDQDWLANTLFWVTDNGELSRRHKYCESRPTWPNNPELRSY